MLAMPSAVESLQFVRPQRVVRGAWWRRIFDRLPVVLTTLILLCPGFAVAQSSSTEGPVSRPGEESGAPASCGASTAGATCGGGGPATQGNTSGTDQGNGNPINLITGNKYQRDVDLPALPGVLGIEIVRHYNSSFSQITHPVRAAGRGWKFSYETELYRIGQTLQVVQADGTRIIFARNPADPSRCASTDPGHGFLEVRVTGRGEEFVWHWRSGRRLGFDHRLKLVSIDQPGGERLTLDYDRQQRLSQIIDPHGRRLELQYTDASLLVRRILTPVGVFEYRYGGHQQQSLTEVVSPARQGLTRHYRYQDSRYPAMLTGIDDSVPGDEGRVIVRRVSAFAYDNDARAIKSIAFPSANVDPSNPMASLDEGVSHQYPKRASLAGSEGLTEVTNSLGEKTLYRFAMIGGENRLLRAIGPGCATCSPGNIAYRYDRGGRLLETTWLRPDGAPFAGLRRSLDRQGRLIQLERVVYGDEVSSSARARRRVESAPASFEVLRRFEYRDGAVSAIRRPSVIDGREHVVTIERNASGQPVRITESGWAPEPASGDPRPIVKQSRVEYVIINGRSLVSQIDGPLPNGPSATPADSDIVRYHYDEAGRQVRRMDFPGGRSVELEHDDAGFVRAGVETDLPLVTRLDTTRLGVSGHAKSVSRQAWLVDAGGKRIEGSLLTQNIDYRFDAFERLVSARTDGVDSLIREYDDASRLSRLTLPGGAAMTLTYDSENRLSTAGRWPDMGVPAQTLAFRYQPGVVFGGMQLSGIADQSGLITTLSADPSGWTLLRSIDAKGVVTGRRQAADGHWKESTRAAGSAEAVVMHYDYDRRGTLIAARSLPSSNRASNLASRSTSASTWTSATAPKSVSTSASTSVSTESAEFSQRVWVDDFGRRVAFEGDAHGQVRYAWDAADRLIARVDETLVVTRYTYDLRGRPLTVGAGPVVAGLRNYYSGPWLIEARATRDGDPRHASEVRRYQRDAIGRVTAEQSWTALIDGDPDRGWETRTFYRYAARGNHLLERRIVDAQGRDHRFDYRYRDDGRLEAILFNGKIVVDRIQSAGFSGLASFRHGNGVNESYQRNVRNRLTGIEVNKDVMGNAKALATIRLYYDEADQLIDSVKTDPEGIEAKTYRYSAIGALIAEQVRGSPTDSMIMQRISAHPDDTAGSEPTARHYAGSAGLTLAAISPAKALFFGYGAAGRMTRAVSTADQQVPVTYRYGIGGERSAKRVGDRVTYYGYRSAGGSTPVLATEANTDGAIVTHYVYLESQPVAKIEVSDQVAVDATSLRKLDSRSVWQSLRLIWSKFTRTSFFPDSEVLGVHADQRSAPYLVTDSSANPIWIARVEASGATRSRVLREKPVEMNLRQGNQYWDQETGLHYNLMRSYDPQKGRYLTPDPLSTSGQLSLAQSLRRTGADAYGYVGGSPLTRTDPAGLYEEDVHYYLQYFLALAAGLPKEQAHLIALANRYVDDNPSTEPFGPAGTNFGPRTDFHFTQIGFDPPQETGESDADYARRRIMNPQNPGLDALRSLWQSETDPCRKAFLYGEAEHSFFDTAAHRDQNNVPYGPNVGHLGGGHDPDMTYNHGEIEIRFDEANGAHIVNNEWLHNQERTVEISREAFERLKTDFGTSARDASGKEIMWDDVKEVVTKFAADKTPADKATDKADQLRRALSKLGLDGTIEDYDCKVARANRLRLVVSSPGSRYSTPEDGQPAGVDSSKSCR